MVRILDCTVETVRQREIYSRENTSTEQRVLGAFLYHAGLSYRKVERFAERSYEAVRQWYHRLAELFEPDRAEWSVVTVNEAKLFVDGEGRYIWAVIDIDTFEAIYVEELADRSSLDVFLFLKAVLERCRGQPFFKADRDTWYDWPFTVPP